MPTATVTKREEQFILMSRHAQGRSFSDWPGWSTGETLIVALILDRHDVLHALRFTMAEAVERIQDDFDMTAIIRMAREV